MDMGDDLELPVSVKAAPADSLGMVDFLLAAGIAAVTAGLLALWHFPGIYPEVWDDLAIAAGLRPAVDIAPGLWHFLVRGLVRSVGLATGTTILKVLGMGAIGLCSGLTYLLFREILALTSRLRLQYSPQRFLIVRLASALGAVFFACSDPVWRAGQIFAPVTLLVFLSVLGAYLFFSFLQGGKLASAYGAMFVLGILSAETPVGFFFVAFCWGVYFLAVRNVLSFDMPLLNPFIEQISKWHMTFLFVLGFLATITLNCLSFGWLGGPAAAGMDGGELPVLYGLRMWSLVVNAASPLGWAIAIGIVVMPCAIAAGLLPRAVDEEQFLPYHIGALFFATALVTYAQLAALPALWMWTWVTHPPMFHSSYLLCLLMLAAAATVTFGLVVLGVDSFCRNHRRLAMQMFAEMQLDDVNGQMLASKRFIGSVRRVGLFVLPLVLLAGVVPGRRQSGPRQMAHLLNDYVQEVCRECGDAKWVFTDGTFDAAIELAAALQGRTLYALSLAGGDRPYDIWLRRRGGADAEDVVALRCDAATLLRTWVRDRPERLAAAALQLGLELWLREGRTPPPCSGVVCRPGGMTPEQLRHGVDAARELAQRIVEYHRDGVADGAAGDSLNRLCLFVQWRLSRMMRQRSMQADMEGNAELALAESRLADELDRCNPALQNLRENMERLRQLTMGKMTPQEGLQLALVRADFALARKYAEPILAADPNDPDANFGMGMSYFAEGQWARAEEFLRRCLLRDPSEPAVYNNLAVIQLKTGRYDAALRSVRKALELAPESAEIKDTLRQIEKLRDADAGTDGRKNRKDTDK